MKASSFLILGLTALLITVPGCGVSQKKLDQAQKRVDALKAKGVPDSALSRARVMLYQARESQKRGETHVANVSADSMMIYIAGAEALYNEQSVKVKPIIDEIKARIETGKAQFTGLMLKEMNNKIEAIDTNLTKGFMFMAENAAHSADSALTRIKFNQERADEIRKTIPGLWECVNKSKSVEFKEVNAVEKKTFDFRSDGSAVLDENKKGISNHFLKEDWQYLSNGTWDLNGDTIKIFVTRFKAARQNFTKGHLTDPKNMKSKVIWETDNHPSYDSTITDGSQDRYVMYQDLKDDFKQIKKY
jgi:hypothetical protein